MPLFEYLCAGCGKQFETLVLGSDAPTCPSCGGKDLKKMLSAHSSYSGQGGAGLPGPGDSTCCGSSPGHSGCAGPGSCCGKA